MNVKRGSLVILLLTISILSAAQEPTPKEPPKVENHAFSVNDANSVLAEFRGALEAHSERRLVALLDGEKMTGLVSFQDQLRGFLSRNDGIRVNIRGIQASGEDEKGVITATFEIETTSRTGMAARKQEQMRFELTRTEQGWRIGDLSPRNFFE